MPKTVFSKTIKKLLWALKNVVKNATNEISCTENSLAYQANPII